AKHTDDHIGLFYTIPENVRKQLFTFGGVPKSLETQLNTFGETCIMVRKPALEVIDNINRTDFNRPVIRYLFYGKPGCGKSCSLMHCLHYAYLKGFYIIHVPWVWNWFRNNRIEVVYSQSHPGLFDLPIVSANWLKHFQSQNSHLLKNNDLSISENYVWNQRENTPSGSPLAALVSHGINRVKYAADCVRAIVNELKTSARNNKCKVFLAIDGFNALFGEETHLKIEDVRKISPDQVSLTQIFLEATKQDWTNGAVLLTVDQLAGKYNTLHSHLPLYLLGKKGFEHIDPFICTSVPELNNLEFNSMLDYYEDRRWLLKPEGRHELSFLSSNNPFQLMNLCAPL
ncbi:hypothetical protein AAG570_000466, partial [Ranatra chinensis]